MIHFQIIIVLIISLAFIIAIVKQARIMIVPAGSVRNLAHWIPSSNAQWSSSTTWLVGQWLFLAGMEFKELVHGLEVGS